MESIESSYNRTIGQAIISMLRGSGGVIKADAKDKNKYAYLLFEAKKSALTIPKIPSRLSTNGISKAKPNKKVVLIKNERYSFTVIKA